MCGRYAVTSAPEAIRALFGYPEQPNFPPRYNVAPTQPIAVVRLIDGRREFALVRWGLLASWVKDPRDFTLLINARGKSVMDKPAFSAAMKRRRCLVPADGFYEWKAVGPGKQPYYVRAKSGAARICRTLGNLDRIERRRNGNCDDRHDARQSPARRHPRTHAGHRRARCVQPVARLRKRRRRNCRCFDCARARRFARGLRSIDRG
jgi:SOS response associated peptidase (SRAP)